MTIKKTLVLHSYSNNSIHFNPTPRQLSVQSPSPVPPATRQVAFENVSASSSPSSDNSQPNTPSPSLPQRVSSTISDQPEPEKVKRSNKCCKDFRKRTRFFFVSTFNEKNLAKTFPIIGWLPQYNLRKFVSDVIAGLTVGLTILPQGLAYATVAGLPPIVIFYTCNYFEIKV